MRLSAPLRAVQRLHTRTSVRFARASPRMALRPTSCALSPRVCGHVPSVGNRGIASTSAAWNGKASVEDDDHAPPERSDRIVITPRGEDYSKWYRDVIAAAEMVDSSPVRGCMVMRPHGYALWEEVKSALDADIKRTGHVNAYFPLLIPQSFLSREAAHVEGFAKECAVVTHHRLRAKPGAATDGSAAATDLLEPDPHAKLAEPLVVRPTSEAIIWHMYGRWIRSHRDLPILINQWANVLRWEMRTRPFLRTSEFLWQEGHTAHATRDEAVEETTKMLDVYHNLCVDYLAMPVIRGEKSPAERFAGADATYTIEAMMQNGWALQAGTSHFLGQNFAKAFDVTYTTAKAKQEHVWATSWGVSTRLIGGLIMTHSDDTGLVLPPRIAPVQVAIVPILRKNKDNSEVLDACAAAADELRAAGVRCAVDTRPHMTPGAKYFEWERKGAPLRLEVGPRDVANGVVTAKQRIHDGREQLPAGGKGSGEGSLATEVTARLDAMQAELLRRATERRDALVHRGTTYEEMREALAGADAAGAGAVDPAGFFLVPWRCDVEAEAAIKAETKATIRCYPLDGQEEAVGKACFYSGEPATHMAIFARAF